MEINELLNIIRKKFEELSDGDKLLVTVSSKHVLKTNILLLQFLLNEKKMNGLYICVDIPQIHLDRLLKKYRINPEGLQYIDAITGLSTLEIEVEKNILYIENPFDVKTINDAVTKVQADGKKRFIILDNMATLQFYSSEISKFFEYFINSVDKFNMSYLLLAVDKNRHKDTYDIIRPYCTNELDIKKEWIELLRGL